MTTPIFILSMVIIAWCINQVAKHGNEMLYPEQTNTTPIRSNEKPPVNHEATEGIPIILGYG